MNKFLSVLFPLLILFAGLALRAAYFEEVRHSPEFRYPLYDPEYNAYWAKGLATDDWTPPSGVRDPEIRTTPHGRPPGYPWFLALIHLIFGVSDTTPRIVQMLLGVINALLLYSLGKRLFGIVTGFFAGLMMALYWVFPYYEGLLTYPALAVFLLLCLFHCLYYWAQGRRPGWLVPVGVLLGAFALLRPNGLLLLPLLLLWILWLGWRWRLSWSRVAFSLVIPVVVCGISLAPAFIRNYIVARDVVFLSSYGGINLYVGNHPEASLVEPRIPELLVWAGIENWSCFDYPAIVRGLAAQQGVESLRFSEANRFFYKEALGFIRENPGRFMINLVKKTILFWGPVEITNDTVPAWDKYHSRVLHYLPGFPWVFALFILGTLCWIFDRAVQRKEKSELELFLWLTVPVYCFSVVIYFVAGRYRVPVIPVLLLFGAYGLRSIAQSFSQKDFKKVFLLTGIFLLASVLTHFQLPGYEASQGTWYLRHALACRRSGNLEEAVKYYEMALKSDGDRAAASANLGRLLIEQGQREAGMDMYRSGLEAHPGHSILENNLGYELYRDGHLAEARAHFERAIKNNPRLALARINLGHLLAEEGDLEGALQHYEEAQRLEPGDYAAVYNTARIFFALGKTSQAISHYQRAVELMPHAVDAWNNLGYCHAVQGAWVEAIPYYERALEEQPSYALAWNNLGNARLASGDSAAAREAYENALNARPEDEAALYNLARLARHEGKDDEAKSFLERCLVHNPDNAQALALLRELDKNQREEE
ncbi:MAG: tetratricopeptide repeat protein [Candidatus Hydrogenedens sp.]|nr:tetratricopeptide repeat protein [Candidatus Hydrogenedens sp.]